MSDQQKPVLTPADLVARWGGAISEGTLGNWRAKGIGPRWFRPSGRRHGKILYLLDDVEDYERRTRQ